MFGSKSEFNDLSYEIITNLKTKYPNIIRVYVRAEYPYINNSYKNYLLQKYEYTYYPDKIINSRKAVYVERNFEMIEKSDICIFYYDKMQMYKSGTKIAYEYAESKGKTVINIKE